MKTENYESYIENQKEKTSNEELRKVLESKFKLKEGIFRNKFSKMMPQFIKEGDNALCLGARMGEEVSALRSLDCNAIGVDLVERKPYVVKCDFNYLERLNSKFDVIYSNALDHAFSYDMFFSSIKKVVKPGTVIILDVFPGHFAKYESLKVDSENEVVTNAEKNGYVQLGKALKDTQLYKTIESQTILLYVPRNIFLDCGGHLGESVDLFKKSSLYDPSYEIYCFEPLPNSAEACKKKRVNFNQVAIWIEDGYENFYTDKKKVTWGSSLLKEKVSASLDLDNPLLVKTIDLSKWIRKNLRKKDNIILKMDIEGAEYEVFKKMIKDKTIMFIDRAYIEWHYDRIGMDKEDHDKLLSELEKLTKVLPEMCKVLSK